jgi:multidrug resistance protein, MATE family
MAFASARAWWDRPAGPREVLRVALPLVVSTSLWTVMHFTDRMFLLWYSNAAMAAVMPAGVLHFTLLCVPLGVVSYVGTFVAQYYGAGRNERIGLVTWQGVWIALAAAPLFVALVPPAQAIFRLVGHAPEVARLEASYYGVLAFGAGGALVAAALSAFFTGRGETRIVMLVDGAAALSHIILDYAWIFGRWGLPEMGITGAAWATVAAEWLTVLLYWAVLRAPRYNRTYGLSAGRRVDLATIRRVLRYGLPSGLQMFLEVAAFSVFLLLLGRLGAGAMTATNLAFNINTLAFVPMMGLGIGVSTLVGQQLGRNRPELASRAVWTGFCVAQLYMGAMAVAYLAFPELFLFGHAWGTDPSRFESLRQVTVVLLRFVAVYCLFDAMNVIFAGALKGAGDTRFILITAAAMAPLPIVGCWSGMRYFGWQLLACWTLITVWICAMGLIYLARFLQGRWRGMRVIEPQLLDNESKPTQLPLQWENVP